MARTQRRENLARLREIARVAARHGFGYLLGRDDRNGDHPAPSGDSPLEVEPRAGTRGRRLRSMLDELGPTFVKFGQLLSTRPDVVPPDIVEELRKLQDDVRPMPFEVAREVMEEDLGLRLDRVFAEFDEVPLAAASIGQVHRARLPGGQEVAVKVQRPDAARQIEADIALMQQAARVAQDRVKRLSFVSLPDLVDEFARGVRRELDYRVEARNLEVAHRNFAQDSTVVVPEVYWRYTTARVLTMERLEGTPLSHFDLESYAPEQRRILANRLAETWMKMIFIHGFFHADPHPANLLVLGPDRLGVVDFGLVGQLTQSDRRSTVQLFLDIVNGDAERMPRRLRELGVRFPREREDEFRDQLGVILSRYHGASLRELDAREILSEIFGAIYRLRITLPTRWMLLDKALATLSGVGYEIYPDFNVFDAARPYARRLVAERWRPDRIAGRLENDLARYAEAFREYPFLISELLHELRDGEVKVTVLPEGFQEYSEKAQAASNRIVLGILGASSFLGSAIVGSFLDSGPTLLGLAVVSFPGFLISLAVGAWVLLGVVRSGRW